MRNTILVTGASGVVGASLVERLAGQYAVKAAARIPLTTHVEGVRAVVMSDLSANQNWTEALTDVDAIVHCAARVHVMQEAAENPLEAFRLANVQGTLNLAEQAARAGVRRFVFVSSVKVNGDSTLPGEMFSADQVPAPMDPYGISKMEAETGLLELARAADMEVTIVRPPLVYGPGVKANFVSMMRWVHRGVPLPFGAIQNQRSLIGIQNLTDLLTRCIAHPAAANQIFLASDGVDVSTTQLLQAVAKAMGRRSARLIPIPAAVLVHCATLARMPDIAQRLCASLQVDIAKTRTLLGWMPLHTLDHELKRTVDRFLCEALG